LPKRIAILGSTGSIGCNALEVIEHLGPSTPVALSAHKQTAKLSNKSNATSLRLSPLRTRPTRRSSGRSNSSAPRSTAVPPASRRWCADDVDLVLAAMSSGGCGGVRRPARGKNIALANRKRRHRGFTVDSEAKKRNVTILPVDSEHSAVFQPSSGRRDESTA